jgi:hypothetical protein
LDIFLIIAPPIFRFWIIPKIEDRVGVNLTVDPTRYIVPFPTWGMSPFEIPTYIVCKYIGCDLKGVRNPMPGTFYDSLKKANYDIKKASKEEIIISFISIFFLVCSFVSGVIIAIYFPSPK